MWKAILVEDEDLLREGLMEFIDWKALGFTIVGDTDNGRKGLELVEELKPHVVITDIRMPGMDGIEMAKKIRERNLDTVLVILSGYDEFEYARSAVRLGVTEYLLKPVQPEQVEELMIKIAAELAASQKDKNDREELQEIKRRSVQEMKQKLIAGFVFGTATENETEELLQLSGWNPEVYWFSAGIIEWKDFSAQSIKCDYLQMMELDQQFKDEFEQRFEKAQLGEHAILFHRNAGEYIVVLSEADEQKLEEMIAHLRYVMTHRKKIEKELMLHFGEAGGGREGILRSFKDAEQRRENAYLNMWNDRSEKYPQHSGEFHFMKYNADALFHSIRSGNKEQLQRELRQFEKSLAEEKIQSQIHLMYVISGFYNELVRLPDEIGISFEESIGNPMDNYSAIVRKQHMSDIMEELIQVCHKIMDLFASSQASQVKVSFRRALEYMEKEYGNSKLLMSDVAAYAYVSNTYFGIILKKETGKTFIEFLTELRVRHAKELLARTDMKNYEVADTCGFSDAAYFSTVFKKACGMSPSAYRKEIQEQ